MRWVAVKLAELMLRKLTQPHGILVLGPAGARRKSSERGLPAGRKPHRIVRQDYMNSRSTKSSMSALKKSISDDDEGMMRERSSVLSLTQRGSWIIATFRPKITEPRPWKEEKTNSRGKAAWQECSRFDVYAPG